MRARCKNLFEHHDDDAAVLRAALRRLVALHGLRVAVGDRGDAAERELVLAREVPPDGLRTLLTELVVVVGAAWAKSVVAVRMTMATRSSSLMFFTKTSSFFESFETCPLL